MTKPKYEIDETAWAVADIMDGVLFRLVAFIIVLGGLLLLARAVIHFLIY
jgi:hypothetical protein